VVLAQQGWLQAAAAVWPTGAGWLAGWCWAGLQGVVHSLLPCAVMQQLGADLAAEIEAALFEAVDE
jgi:hypothetical protein